MIRVVGIFNYCEAVVDFGAGTDRFRDLGIVFIGFQEVYRRGVVGVEGNCGGGAIFVAVGDGLPAAVYLPGAI